MTWAMFPPSLEILIELFANISTLDLFNAVDTHTSTHTHTRTYTHTHTHTHTHTYRETHTETHIHTHSLYVFTFGSPPCNVLTAL
jgi:ABC-type nickel/cobalt efflux system permease component RcnA